ncbi:MAG: hypothetical protein AAGC92_07820 [Pseudomonadota bacterium]
MLVFETLQTISLNGTPGRANDDRVGATQRLAWVIDGATDLGPPGLLGPQGGAAWLADTASLGFARSEKPSLAATCAEVFAFVAVRYAADRTRDVQAAWERPKAAFAAVQLVAERLHIAWAADCAVLLLSRGGGVWGSAPPDSAAEAADAQALGPGVGADPVLSAEALADRRAHRSRRDHIALSPDANASAASTCHADVPVSPGDAVMLMSDGFSALLSEYGRYRAETFMDALQQKGLEGLAAETRAIERADAACLRYPRFKVSDDLTAIWLRVAG